MRCRLLCSFVIMIAVATTLPAQELLAVDFSGNAHAVGVFTGLSRSIGATGASQCNAMALHEGVLYSTARTGLSGPRQLVTIDPITAQATVLLPNINVDLRGLCENPGSTRLFGIANGAPDKLVHIDVVTGQVSLIGNTGLSGIQALSGNEFAAFLFGWDVNVGLVRIGKATGAAVDVDASIGTQGADIQFLTAKVDDNLPLIGGNTTLYQFQTQTGVVTPLGTASGLADLRGAELHRGRSTVLGSGCSTALGVPSTLGAKGSFLAGQALSLSSTSHAPNTVALLVVGMSSASYQGVPLPIDLDSVLGTVGCQLQVSVDLTLATLGTASGAIALSFTMPPILGGSLHFQLATLEAVPGGFAFSNGITVQTPF